MPARKGERDSLEADFAQQWWPRLKLRFTAQAIFVSEDVKLCLPSKLMRAFNGLRLAPDFPPGEWTSGQVTHGNRVELQRRVKRRKTQRHTVEFDRAFGGAERVAREALVGSEVAGLQVDDSQRHVHLVGLLHIVDFVLVARHERIVVILGPVID